MANADYRSNSAQPVIVKILSDYADWNELVKADQYRKQYFEQRNKEMVIKPSTNVPPKIDTGVSKSSNQPEPVKDNNSTAAAKQPELTKETKNEQVGSGIGDIVAKVSQCVREIVKEELTAFIGHFGKFFTGKKEQVGSGADDLVQQLPSKIESDTAEPLAGSTSENKNINEWTSQEDIDKLVNSVPSRDRRRARELLNFFVSNPLLVSWDALGRVTIVTTAIPLSNIYNLFKQLYSANPDKTVPGFYSLSSFILSSGQKSLTNISNKYYTRSAKRQYPLNLEDFDEQKAAPKRPWYFIGDMPDV